jgi:glycosyltransferase involved in cell wall biosynthesis
MKPRLLLVARERYDLPLADPLQRKFDALEREFEVRVLASAADGQPSSDERFRLVRPLRPRRVDGLGFYLALPARVARELRSFEPDAVLVQGTHETAAVLLGRRLARRESTVILDVHGDWRGATRLYGSPLRRLLDPAGDVLSFLAVRKVDAIRTVSTFTTGLVRELGREPAAVFPAYVDVASFLARPPAPLPERPVAIFVGVLERTKNIDGLVEAWRLAAPRVPEATLRLVGRGRETALVEGLLSELPEQTRWTPSLTNPEVADALDGATTLVLPSRSEGLARVALEAFARGRGVIGCRAAGVRDLIEDGENGLLVHAGDPPELAGALVRVLLNRSLAERLGAEARRRAEGLISTPEEYARSVRALVDEARNPAAY